MPAETGGKQVRLPTRLVNVNLERLSRGMIEGVSIKIELSMRFSCVNRFTVILNFAGCLRLLLSFEILTDVQGTVLTPGEVAACEPLAPPPVAALLRRLGGRRKVRIVMGARLQDTVRVQSEESLCIGNLVCVDCYLQSQVSLSAFGHWR